MATTVHHTNIRVTDPEASVRFYEALGLTHSGTLSMGPGYTLLYMTDSKGLAVELVVNSAAQAGYDRSPGSGHLGFHVDDIRVVLARLAELGVRPEGPPASPAGRTDLSPIAFVRDPDGVRIELLQSPWPIPSDPLPDDLQHLATAR